MTVHLDPEFAQLREEIVADFGSYNPDLAKATSLDELDEGLWQCVPRLAEIPSEESRKLMAYHRRTKIERSAQ